MRHRKLLAVATALAALAPLAAAARVACCLPKPARHACCASEAPSAPMEMRGCCKAPKAPDAQTRIQDRSPLGIAAPARDASLPAGVTVRLAPAPALRLARLGSRAPAPDVSPPDLLSRHATLLI